MLQSCSLVAVLGRYVLKSKAMMGSTKDRLPLYSVVFCYRLLLYLLLADVCCPPCDTMRLHRWTYGLVMDKAVNVSSTCTTTFSVIYARGSLYERWRKRPARLHVFCYLKRTGRSALSLFLSMYTWERGSSALAYSKDNIGLPLKL